MLILTTPSIEGATITDYHGIVSGEDILTANIFSLGNIGGGGSANFKEELRRAKDLAIAEMATQANRRGANAVVGVDLDYETIGGGNVLMVNASGTAVTYVNSS